RWAIAVGGLQNGTQHRASRWRQVIEGEGGAEARRAPRRHLSGSRKGEGGGGAGGVRSSRWKEEPRPVERRGDTSVARESEKEAGRAGRRGATTRARGRPLRCGIRRSRHSSRC